jgi:hypothetical protein
MYILLDVTQYYEPTEKYTNYGTVKLMKPKIND